MKIKSFKFYMAMIVFACLVFAIFTIRASSKTSSSLCANVDVVKICVPSTYFRIKPNPNDPSSEIWLSVPSSEFEVISGDYSGQNVLIVLERRFENFRATLNRALFNYETSVNRTKLESGFIVSEAKDASKHFSPTDILHSPNEPVYFICAREWVDVHGNLVDTLCEANLNWIDDNSNTNIRLRFHMPRKKIGQWKKYNAAVRSFIYNHRKQIRDQ